MKPKSFIHIARTLQFVNCPFHLYEVGGMHWKYCFWFVIDNYPFPGKCLGFFSYYFLLCSEIRTCFLLWIWNTIPLQKIHVIQSSHGYRERFKKKCIKNTPKNDKLLKTWINNNKSDFFFYIIDCTLMLKNLNIKHNQWHSIKILFCESQGFIISHFHE